MSLHTKGTIYSEAGPSSAFPAQILLLDPTACLVELRARSFSLSLFLSLSRSLSLSLSLSFGLSGVVGSFLLRPGS